MDTSTICGILPSHRSGQLLNGQVNGAIIEEKKGPQNNSTLFFSDANAISIGFSQFQVRAHHYVGIPILLIFQNELKRFSS